MDLRQLKKEVHSLPDLSEHLQKFQQNWVKPIKANTNKHFPSLQHLAPEKKQKINTTLFVVQQKLKELESAQIVTQKLQEYAHHLIELKLTTLNGNKAKRQYITKLLLYYEFLNTKSFIDEVIALEKNLKSIYYKYHQINEIIQKEASLEEAVHFLHLPHKEHLQQLLTAAKKQKILVKHLGGHFVSLVKETRKKK